MMSLAEVRLTPAQLEEVVNTFCATICNEARSETPEWTDERRRQVERAVMRAVAGSIPLNQRSAAITRCLVALGRLEVQLGIEVFEAGAHKLRISLETMLDL